MPSLSQHSSGALSKLLLIGDSGSGKTGSLASLAKAGFKLRILDLDNGLDSLAAILRREAPDKLDNIQAISFRDKQKMGAAGVVYEGTPKAFINAMKALDKWPDDESTPAKWGPDHVLVLDSMTFLGDAAYNWQDAMNPAAKDKRQIYMGAQEAVENVISLLTSPDFNCNVVVISHVRWQERPDGTMKGFPSAIGGALSLKIATYFNSVILAERTGTGTSEKRTLRTASSQLIDLKNPASKGVSQSLPIETGLADFFKALQA